MKKLQSKVVFITGGNSGIGKAAAMEAAKEGATVVVADLPGSDHKHTMQEISDMDAPCLFVPIDVSDVESVKAAITATVERFGRLNVAFNNAGIGAPLLSAAPDEVHQAWIEGTPAKRLGKASEVAKAFIYLACDDSSYCNGTQIILDGGVMA